MRIKYANHKSIEINQIVDGICPSKSHMIRWLVAASQNEQETIIKFNGEPGKDIISMKRCIENFGVEVTESENIGKLEALILEEEA